MPKEKIEKIRWARKPLLIIGLLVIALLIGGRGYMASSNCRLRDEASLVMSSHNATYTVEVVVTSEDKRRGLGGRNCLADGSGMLFVYDTSGDYGIWMKDMQFPIDIVWMDEGKRVVTVKEDVAPQTYPSVLYPTEKSRYILELPAGSVSRDKLSVGTQMRW